MSSGMKCFLRAELDYSTSDLSRLVTVLINTVIILMIAVAITLLISRHLRRLSQASILQSHHKLLGEKVIVTKTAGPETNGMFRTDSGEEGNCFAEEWIYPGMPARITNYDDGLYKVRPLHIDYRDLSSKEDQNSKFR